MKHILFLIFLSSCCCNIFAQKAKPITAIKWETYTDNANNFSLIYPNNWTLRIPDSTEKAKLFIRSPKEGDNDMFIENLNVTIRKMQAATVEIKDFPEAIKTALKKRNGFELLQDKIIKSNDVDAYFIEYILINKVNDVDAKIKMTQQIFYKNKTLYTITYTALNEAPIEFYTTAIKIMDNFKALH
jgi:predicted acetyltransferase